MTSPRTTVVVLPLLAGLTACFTAHASYQGSGPASPQEGLERFFEEVFLSRLDRSSSLRARVELWDARRGWDDRSPERALIDRALLERELEALRSRFGPRKLRGEARTSRALFVFEAERELARAAWRGHEYLVRPGDGWPADVPRTLLHTQAITSEQDVEAYLTLLAAAPGTLGQLIEELERRRQRGHFAPHFAYRQVIEECHDLLAGRPFEATGGDGILLADLRRRLAALDLDEERSASLEARAIQSMTQGLQPAYEELIATLEELEGQAAGDDGVWALPEGDAYYASALQDATTLQLTASALHHLGLQEVADLQEEMRRILRQLGHQGGISGFSRLLREDPGFFLPNDEQGRSALLDQARGVLEVVDAHLEELVPRRPATGLVIEGRDGGSPSTRYGPPAYRPGDPSTGAPAVWTLDLSDTRVLPSYLIPARVHRGGIPGRHLRVSITAELEGLPRFRRALEIPAWSQGWDLYAAGLPLELGLISDPQLEFGRLVEELWAACLLVIDSGLHHERWSRSHATAWLTHATLTPEALCVRAVDHALLHPAEAAAAPVGLVRLRELRQRAEEQLGEAFDLREFHALVLGAGPLPIGMLEERVEAWIAAR